MGRDLWESSKAAREVFTAADAVLDIPLSRICFEGPEDRLRDTETAQPAIMTVSLACLAAALESGAAKERPAFVAGHSLGEYSAIVAAGALDLNEALRLIQARARLMAEAGVAHPGTLAAIIGLDEAAVREVCVAAGADVCNLNLPNQTVIGGTRAAVARAIVLAKERGAQRAIELNVSGAFHSRLMLPAAEGLRPAIEKAAVGDADVPVVSNVTAQPLSASRAIREEMSLQISSPVRWHESVRRMADHGVTTFVEFGPGKVLTGMVRRLVEGARLVNVSSMADLAGAGETAIKA